MERLIYCMLLFVTEVLHSCRPADEAVNILYVVVCDRCCCLWQRYYIPAARQGKRLMYCMLLFVTDVVVCDRGTTFLPLVRGSGECIVCCCLWQMLLFVTEVLHSCRPAGEAVNILYIVVCDRCCCLWQMLLFVTEVLHFCRPADEAVNILYVVVCDRCCCLWQRYYIPAARQMKRLIYCMLLLVTKVLHSCRPADGEVNIWYVVVCDRCCCLWQRYYIPAARQMERLIYGMLLFVTEVLHSCRPADGVVNILFVVICDRGTTFLPPGRWSG